MQMKLMIVSLVLFVSCSAARKAATSTTASSGDTLIEMRKTPCYGTCPVYTIVILDDGKSIYTGRQFVDKTGRYEKKFSKEEIKKLIQAFEEAKFFDLQDEYTGNVTDMPTIYVTFTYHGKTKKVKDYYNAPAALHALEKMVEQMANTEGWAKVGDGR